EMVWQAAVVVVIPACLRHACLQNETSLSIARRSGGAGYETMRVRWRARTTGLAPPGAYARHPGTSHP
ncbi:MAG: hypothetical protein M1541_04620, partial [Acidobacteria bacterium]|nr:hypothetical protein [Acidobacteriota bacterium]